MNISDINVTTTEDYEYYDTYNETDGEIERNKHPEVVFFGLPIVVLAVIIMCTHNYFKKAQMQNFVYILKGHLLSGFQHQIFIIIQWYFPVEYVTEVLYYFVLVTPVWTLCLSVLMFLKIYLFKSEEDLYTKKGVTLFVSTSGAIIQAYEDFFYAIFGYSSSMKAALKLTSILLIISPSFVICGIIIKSLLTKSKVVTLQQGLYFVLNISLLTISDLIMVLYEFGPRGDSFEVTIAIVLSIRLIVEVMWITFLRSFSIFIMN